MTEERDQNQESYSTFPSGEQDAHECVDIATSMDSPNDKCEPEPKDPLTDALLVKSSSRDLLPILLTISSCMGAFLFGYHVGFSSPTQKSLKANVPDKTELDLVFSIINIGAIFGSIAAGPLAQRLGRRFAILFCCIPFAGGAVLMANCVEFTGLLFGRLVIGVGVGYSSVLVPLYIAEISPPHLRGTLGCFNQLFISGGILLVNCAGLPIVKDPNWWKMMLYLSLIPAAIQFVTIFLFGPETPRWLCSNDRQEEAVLSLIKLRGPEWDHQAEIDATECHLQHSASGAVEHASLFTELKKWKNLHPLLIGIGLMLLQQWSGINAIIFNTTELFESDSDAQSSRESYASLDGAIAVNAIQALVTLLASLFIDKVGRRAFLLCSVAGMSLCSAGMAIATSLNCSVTVKVVIMMGYISSFAFGVGPLPWLLCSEIFPSSIRGPGMSISTVINWLSSFLVTLSFSSINSALADGGAFLLYAAICAVGFGFVYWKVPETREKSLEEIEEFFE